LRSTYVEVDPAKADAARRLLAGLPRCLKDKARSVRGIRAVGRPNHFVIVEQWPSAKAREDNAASAPGRDFRAALTRC